MTGVLRILIEFLLRFNDIPSPRILISEKLPWFKMCSRNENSCIRIIFSIQSLHGGTSLSSKKAFKF